MTSKDSWGFLRIFLEVLFSSELFFNSLGFSVWFSKHLHYSRLKASKQVENKPIAKWVKTTLVRIACLTQSYKGEPWMVFTSFIGFDVFGGLSVGHATDLCLCASLVSPFLQERNIKHVPGVLFKCR